MPADQKAAIVLSILAGEVTAAEAARSAGVTGQAISNWKRRFIEAGCGGLEATSDQQANREVELRKEIAQLKSALGDSYLQLQAIRRTMRTRAGAGGPARVSADTRAKEGARTRVPARLNGGAPVPRSA
ncbi:transposase [Streptomyces sp. Ru73]|uniref:transposase n=1 Tax=Streptomyces sp. Ru73 TaxID=2080748 RepID=UPI000CDDA810|nr:transposase [Streptomyces sp. Ru73]POX38817.1 transposase [Streptomyces sp. Ru73]